MKITFYGAAREVTGSKHMIEVNGKRILLDCGLFQGRRKEAQEKNRTLPFDPRTIDAVLLSHAHIDHSGALPLLVKYGFSGPIYSTFATRDVVAYMLADSAFIQTREAEFMNKRRRQRNGVLPSPVLPLYTVEDVQQTMKQFVGVGYEQTFAVTEGFAACFYDAGHILGSSLIHILTYDKKSKKRCSVTYTGDLGRKNLPILRDPQMVPESHTIITECTYGNRLHKDVKFIDDELAEIVNETAKKGGKVLIPAFALERAQEIVYYLNRLWQKKRIPDIPVFVDSPLSVNLTQVFTAHPECFDRRVYDEFLKHSKNPFGFGHLRYINAVEDSKKLNEYRGPAIIIAASGMCEFGRILHHLKNNIEDPRNKILIVGFQAEHTLGRKLVEKQPVVNIFGEPYKVKAEVKVMDAFSAHADKHDLVAYLKKVKGLKHIFLVHGEEKQGMIFQETLKKGGFKDVRFPYPAEKVEV